MEFVRTVKIKSSFSFAVCLIDAYTGSTPLGSDHEIILTGTNAKPIKKIGGYYVFTDLPTQSYQIRIQSKLYIQESSQVYLELLDANDPIVYIALTPNALYPFDQDSTTLVALLQNSQGKALENVAARATVTTEDCYKAKLAQDISLEGCKQIYLAQVTGKLLIGDWLFLKNEQGESEYVRIASIQETTRCCTLEKPMQFLYDKGSMLFPVSQTLSDAKGEMIVFFKNFRVKAFQVSLEFTYENEKHVQELDLEQGKLLSLGIIRLVN
ncbi:MAG: hypothetical protein JWM44_2047 [Bacilli bacterium]|nr:hypothetical protein [Bacilli bacterium]